jgi:citrate lyase beta subunit
MLFVSGEQPSRFDKAVASGADLICIDLEDAVAQANKASARTAAVEWLRGAKPRTKNALPALGLRINRLQTTDGLRDLLMLAACADLPLDWLLLPKVEDAADIRTIHSVVDSCDSERDTHPPSLAALIETPRGLEHSPAIARAGTTLQALMLGGADLSLEIGAGFTQNGLAWSRGRLVNAAKAAGLQAWDVPFVHVDRPAELESEARLSFEMGFDCKAAIHPLQIAHIVAAAQPSPAEVEWAQSVIAALSARDRGGAFRHRGQMVDEPLVKRANLIVQRLGRGECANTQ